MFLKKIAPSSIKEALSFCNRTMILLTILPVLLISCFYLVNMYRYQNIISNVNFANKIRSSATSEISTALWYQVAGKNEDKEKPIDIIARYESQLEELKDQASSNEHRQTAVVASRILQTIERYAWEIDSNINNNEPVEKNEEIIEEIYEVNELLDDTLGEYVTSEINLAAQKNSQISKIIIALVFLELLIIIGLLIFVRYFQRYLDRSIQVPIHRFSNMVSEISQGNWQVRVQDVDVKELDSLGNDLNKMANQVEILFEENTQKQKSLAVSEMKVLQAQITPHFIYNTLDAILTLSQQNDGEKVQEITYALSNYFKITLNKGNEWITVNRELQHIESYLAILKIRYGPILSYSITVDPDIRQTVILKMILQPLVENAMYHGIKKSRGRGKIAISGERKGKQLCFTITDNGIGMRVEKLNEVKANLIDSVSEKVDSSDLGGYGLYNVYRRLKLYFSDQADLSIESTYKTGTRITILLPAKEGHEHGE